MLTALQRLSNQVFVSPFKRVESSLPVLQQSQQRIQDKLSVRHTRSLDVPGVNKRITGLLSRSADLQDSLQRIQQAPDEQSLRDARASFRVAIRSLDLPALHNLAQDIQQEIATTGDFRTQRFLDQLSQDVHLERFDKGAKLSPPAVQQPELPGNTPESILAGSLHKLNTHASEANFRETLAGFRVAIRQLSPEQLQETRGLLSSAISSSEDYRTQLMLNSLNNALTQELIHQGVKQPAPGPNMPPVLSTRPILMVEDALALLHKNVSQAQFKTALAAVRVSARNLTPENLDVLKQLFQSETQNDKHDYRTQLFLYQAMQSLI